MNRNNTFLLLVGCLILLGFSLLLNLHYMGRWSGELRTQYEMGYQDGKTSAFIYWETELEKARANNLTRFILSELHRTQAQEQYIALMESYSAEGLGWSTGRSNAP